MVEFLAHLTPLLAVTATEYRAHPMACRQTADISCRREATLKSWVICACAAAALSGQFSADVEFVPLNVSVLDSRQQFIEGLGADDFSVYENGRRQDVSFFGPAALPLDVALLIDVSDSMSESLPVVRQAARGFVERLRPDDRAAIVGFARHLRVQEGLTSDRGALAAAVDRLEAYGPTAVFDALYVTSRQFERDRARSSSIRRQAIVVLSDGRDTASHVSSEDAMAAARRCGATIYTIKPQAFETYNPSKDGTRDMREADFFLQTLARDTGGRLFTVTDASNLPDIYATVTAELRHQYTLAFKPERRSDERPRQLVVRLLSRPGAIVRTRRSYEPSR